MAQSISYQLTDFQKDVLDQSQDIPVLVDYWASWCEPCKFLGPIVEKLAAEASDKWKLIKINTEEHSDIATEWGIRGVPNLKLFYKGSVIADLAGAMAEPEMRDWLEQKLPSEAKSLSMEASNQIALGNTKKGISLLEKAIDVDTGLNEARLLLAKLIIWKDPTRVQSLVEEIKHVEEAEELTLLANFLSEPQSSATKSTIANQFIKIRALLLAHKVEAAVEMLIKTITLDKQYNNELARRLTIAIFHILGEASAITKKYRRPFDMALY